MITNWAVSPADQSLIQAIAYRAHELSKRLGMRGDEMYRVRDAMMDLTATHNYGCALDLARLQVASDADFAHDVFGIRANLDRDTGMLGYCFTPRFHA